MTCEQTVYTAAYSDRLPESTSAECRRFVWLLQCAVDDLDLDLNDMTVLTEAASGWFSATALLAALAGASVVAIGRDSHYGSFETVQSAMNRQAARLGVADRVRYTSNRRDPMVADCNIVTNCGFVRPLDADLLSKVGNDAVISYMYEAWEARQRDVDLKFCETQGIPVYYSDEDGWGQGVFSSCGMLAVKLCMEAGLEVAGNAIGVVSSDRFGDVILSALRMAGANARSVLLGSENATGLFDAIVVADYCQDGTVIDKAAANETLASLLSPGGTVIQFVGPNDRAAIRESGFGVYPDEDLVPHRMARTLAHLGPRPVVRLSAIGLKVGGVAATGVQRGLHGRELDSFVVENSPAQLAVDVAREGEEK